MSTTIAVQYAVHSYTGNAFDRISEKRIGISVPDSGTTIRRTLDQTPINIGSVDGFLMIQAEAPFKLTIQDLDSNSSNVPVGGLFIAYISAKDVVISWDPVLQKEGKIHIYLTR